MKAHNLATSRIQANHNFFLKAVHTPQEAEARAAHVSAQLREARKAWDDERASLQAKVAEGQEQRNSLAAREAQACDRANTLQAQLQAAETARGESPHASFFSAFAYKGSLARWCLKCCDTMPDTVLLVIPYFATCQYSTDCCIVIA